MIGAPVAHDQERHARLVRVFGYLLRAELKKLYKSSVEKSLIAGTTINLVAREIEKAGVFRCKNKTIGKDELDAMIEVAKKFHEKKAEFYKTGVLSDSFVEIAIGYARIDSIFRANVFSDVEEPVEKGDVEDIRAIYGLIQNEMKRGRSVALDNDFHCASLVVGGADVDLVIDGAIIDIKTTKKMSIKQYWPQIVGYYVLWDINKEVFHGERKEVSQIGMYFSRFGKLWLQDIAYVRANGNYERVVETLIKAGKAALQRSGKDLKEMLVERGCKPDEEGKKATIGSGSRS